MGLIFCCVKERDDLMVIIIKENLDIEEFNQVYSLDSTLKQKQ